MCHTHKGEKDKKKSTETTTKSPPSKRPPSLPSAVFVIKLLLFYSFPLAAAFLFLSLLYSPIVLRYTTAP